MLTNVILYYSTELVANTVDLLQSSICQNQYIKPDKWDVALSVVECPLMVGWVIRLIPQGGTIELFLIPTTAPQLV